MTNWERDIEQTVRHILDEMGPTAAEQITTLRAEVERLPRERAIPWMETPQYASMARQIDVCHEDIRDLRAQVERLHDVIRQGAMWFAEYERSHTAKGDKEKAQRNGERASFLRAALTPPDSAGEE